MRIAITSPYCWPQVRRGSERFMNELADYLVAQGHEVTVVSTHVGDPIETTAGRRRDIVFAQRFVRFRERRTLNPGHGFAFQVRALLKREPFDWVHSLSYHDAFGAAVAKADGASFRLVMNHVGIPVRKYFRRVPHDYLIFRRALRSADTHLVTSTFAGAMLERDFGYRAARLPIPVYLTKFPCKAPSQDGPVSLLFVGDANEERKGAEPLVRAFKEVKKHHPDAELHFSGHMSDERRAHLMSLLTPAEQHAVHVHGLGNVEDIPGHYRAATVTVLPSIWEAFGMVLVESLSSGTPVVGCAHAGLLDIVQHDGLGRLCSPGTERGAMNNIHGLTQAILETIELARDPGTAPRCHNYAQQFSWDELGPQYEALYHDPQPATLA